MSESATSNAVAGDRLRFVDAHHHFQDIKSHYYPWLCDKDAPPKLEGDISSIRRNYLPEDFFGDVSSAELIKSVHVQNGWDPRDPVGETRWLQELADRTGFPNAIVAFADLAAPDVEQLLADHCESANVRGIRQILNWHDNPALRVAGRSDPMGDDKWRRGFECLGKFALSFDLQIYWTQWEQAYRLARDFPGTLILLNHFGMPVDRSPDAIAGWDVALAHLAELPNMMIKLSGVGLGHPTWTIDDTAPLLRRAIDIFGSERAMFGTNLPVDSLFAKPARIIECYSNVLQGFDAAERVALTTTNAERAYRI